MPTLTEDFVKNRVARLANASKSDQIVLRDDKLTGFLLRVRRAKDGSLWRSFFFEYLPPGETKKRKRLAIGPYPTFSAEDARERAAVMARAVKDGNDPAAIRAQQKAKPTLETAWAEFDREHLSLKEPATRKDYKGRYRRIILPTFKGRQIESITRAEVNALRTKFRDKPTDLNRALAVLSKLMSFAMLKEWRGDNPVAKVERFDENINETWLDENELPKFVEQLVKVEGPMGDLLRFIAVSGWRVSAARLLRFDQVDLSRLEVRLDDKATKKNATALSTDAAMLIERQPHRIGYVFSQRKGSYPLAYDRVLDALAGVCKEAGINRITPHTLRRTIATHSALAGANVAELMQSYGWKTPAMALRYVKKSESLARKGVERGASIVNVFQKPAAEVIPQR
ncbi:tyrosine-type recombinase/integrase [Sinorhizobium meliloti]|uniref:tyrosine-type recombinase/integrase n=1 Tax=Rhizobium meliloti TaxID=382 RepID=UPI003F172C52